MFFLHEKDDNFSHSRTLVLTIPTEGEDDDRRALLTPPLLV